MDFTDLAFQFQWEQCFSLVNHWHKTMIDQIEKIHEKKISQIQLYKTRAEKSFHREKNQWILDLNEYFQHESIRSEEIHCFKKKLNQFKENLIHRPLPLNIQIQSPSSVDNSITIRPFFTRDFFDEKTILVQYPIPTKSIRFLITSDKQLLLVSEQSIVWIYDSTMRLIDQMNLLDYTKENLHGISWSGQFLFLFEYSLWALEEFVLNKLAHIVRKTHLLFQFTCLNNSLFLLYDQGEFIDRWKIQPEWKLDKRWHRQELTEQLQSITANTEHILLYTNKSIQLYSEDFILQYNIDLSNGEHHFSDFVYLSNYEIWFMIDRQTHLINYFHRDDRVIQKLEQIFVQIMNVMNDSIVWIKKDHNQLQIISIE